MSQMYIKHVIFEPWRNIYFSTYPSPKLTNLSHRFTIWSKLTAQTSFHCLSHSRISVSTSSSSAKRLPSRMDCFTRQTLPTVNRKHFFMNILCIVFVCPQKPHNKTLLFRSTFLKHRRHFYYWNQPLNLRMRVCYLDCHEARLCCYIAIHIENLNYSCLTSMRDLFTDPRL
jgi:hypothetical protein